MTDDAHTPVLIVGGGPIGLSLANELGWRGIPCTLVEAGDGEVLFPAGEFLFSRTLEHFRRWGIASAVRNLGWPHPEYRSGAVFVTTVAGHELARFVSSPAADPRDDPSYPSPERPLIQARFTVDPYLRSCAEKYPGVAMLYRHRLVDLVDDPTGSAVRATLVDERDGTVRHLDAGYVVGCDGARSTVRTVIGARLEGEFGQGHNFAIYFRSRQLRALVDRAGMGDVCQVQTVAAPARPYVTVVDGGDLWRCSVYVTGDDADPDPVEVVRAAAGAPVDVEVLRAQRWTGHEVVADRYRRGRVFLAGDAAHLRWPKGGFGANTGIGDAIDIGWKLAAMHDGWAGPGLLASYEPERRPIALRNNALAAENWRRDREIPSGRHLDDDSPAGETARADAAATIVALRAREYQTQGVQLGYRYANSPVCVYDDGPVPADRPDRYTVSTAPGTRAPHLRLGDDESILDRFGRGFTLVRTDPALPVDGVVAAARTRGVPLTVPDIGDVAGASDVYDVPLVLVRPDGHIAWRAAAPPADPGALIDVVRGGVPSPDRKEPPMSVPLRMAEIVLRTPNLPRLRDWYERLLGHGPFIERQPSPGHVRNDVGGQERASDLHLAFFLVHEGEHPYKQVLALFEIEGLSVGGPAAPGLHHMQFRLATFDDLVVKFEEFAASGILPHRAANHGMGTSFYYRDPDGNIVELSCANFPSREAEKAYSTSEKFARNPSGVELDPADFIGRIRAGEPLERLLVVPD